VIRSGVLLCAACLVLAAPAVAQPRVEPRATETSGVAFLSRFAVHLEASHLVHDSERYVWDAEYAGEVDVLDYVKGRITLFATYHVVLGEQFQLFDPNQGNYVLGAMGSVRAGAVEVAGVFYHQSRHLSDRVRPFGVDWNMMGARVTYPVRLRGTSLEPSVDVRGVTQHSFVDYRWEIDAYLRARRPLRGALSLVGEGNVRRLGTDGTANRGTQTGARGEAAVRFEGRRAAVELFVAVERRIDPFPLERGIERWASAGFRLSTR
jgi:hypothetical protein